MKKFNITVNGVSYEVDVEEIKDGAAPSAVAAPRPQAAAPAAAAAPAPAASKAPAAAPAPAAAAPAGGTTVESPMPGNIWKVLVKEGQQVKDGETLIILEAMKMENDIPSPCDGVVASLHVAEGAAVNGGDILVSIK
jgi:glutaconyl-CoA/methylmalonyl-CoA decarboxylase subunit gamma